MNKLVTKQHTTRLASGIQSPLNVHSNGQSVTFLSSKEGHHRLEVILSTLPLKFLCFLWSPYV